MHKEHYVFKTNQSESTPIWRYMDFWKFLNLLETSSLYFSQASKLGDQYEGTIPHFIEKKMLEEDKFYENQRNKELISYLNNKLRDTHLISSWIYKKRESFAMWKMYAKDKTGIAIQTDINSLKMAFEQSGRDIYIGEVNYVNEEEYYFNTGNLFYPFITKLDFYKYESEVRCITTLKEDEINENKLVKINLNKLIKKVYISPNSRKEFEKLLQILKREYELDFEIEFSKINDNWL